MKDSLPEERLQLGYRPCTFFGLYFVGPLMVKIGHRHELPYGAMSASLTIKAVHVNLALYLTTDATIMAIRKMSLQGYRINKYFRTMEQRSVELMRNSRSGREEVHFPSSPHMGGPREALVHSVKRVLQAILMGRVQREEGLLTLLKAAEDMVKIRHLTHVLRDPPNQLIS